MADIGFYHQVLPTAFVTSTKTLGQILAASNQRVVVNEWDVSFNGTSNTATPIEVDVVRQTSAGTSSAGTLHKRFPGDPETLNTTCLITFTAEPTDAGDVPLSEQVHPQTGYTWQAPFGAELRVQGGARLGIRVVTPGAAASASVRAGCIE